VKIGNESSVKTGIAVALIAFALFLLVRWFIGQNGAAAPSPTQARSTRQPAQVNALDPTLRTDLLKDSEQSKYENKGRNIFVAEAEIPHETQPVLQKPPETTIVQPTNTPPPINVKFFGFASNVGEPKKIFLSQGEDIWVAKEGDVVNRRYRVLKINPNSVEIEDVLNNNRQSIPLTQS
jgi:hypothetical protein